MPYMAANTISDPHTELVNDPVVEEENEEVIRCSIGIMAYNEEANIERTLQSVLEQTGPSIHIDEVIVVASGCTDRTVPIVAEMALQEPRIHLCVQEKREGGVYDKGPATVRDLLKQRRRIYAGHLKVLKQQNYEASTMKVTPIFRQLIACRHFALSTPKQVVWTLIAMMFECYARFQGHYDYWRKREHHIWQAVSSTKDLEEGEFKMRRICNAQSVIVFRLLLEGAKHNDVQREREDREANEAARKLLPILRTEIRKEDKLSINGPGIMTAIIRAEQQ